MTQLVVGFALVAWALEALVLGLVMGRRGYDARAWTGIGAFLGPIAPILALTYAFRPAPRDPRLLRAGRRGPGGVDVLVGVDGSPESVAAIAEAARLVAGSVGRFTLVRVVPRDMSVEDEREIEREVLDLCELQRTLEPAAVILRGEPLSELIDYSSRLGYDLLVAGSRGEGRSHAPLGSVATRLARGAGVPVLLVDGPRRDTSRRSSLRAVRAS